MKNFIQPGRVVNVIAPRTLASGDGALVGTSPNVMFGVATKAAANATEVPVVVEGVVNLPKLTTDVVAIGAALYWDNTNFRVTLTGVLSPGPPITKPVGYAASAAGNGVATVWVKLTPNLTPPSNVT